MNKMRLVILLVALGAGLAAWMMARNLDTASVAAPAIQESVSEQVLVASRDIAPGHAISAADLRWSPWPDEAVSPVFVSHSVSPTAMEDMVGSVTRGALASGEPIRAAKLIQGDRGGYMSAILPQGKRAVSMRTSPQTGAGGFILPNDRVDVILIRPDTDRLDPATEGALRYTSERILENVRVLAIDQTVEEQDGRTVVVGSVATLELSPEQVETLVRGDQLGDLSLALRSILDGAPPAEEAVVPADRTRSVNVVKFGTLSRVGFN